MEHLGVISVCFLEQLRPLLRAWTFVTYYINNTTTIIIIQTINSCLVDCGWASHTDTWDLGGFTDVTGGLRYRYPSLGSRLALYGSPYRPAMVQH
jgi:hypothetical protein